MDPLWQDLYKKKLSLQQEGVWLFNHLKIKINKYNIKCYKKKVLLQKDNYNLLLKKAKSQ